MKKTQTDNGWTEVVTTNITITSFSPRPLSDVSDWLKFHVKHPKLFKKRTKCNCCGKKWENLSGNVNLVFTDKGNKIICDECHDFFKERFGKVEK